MTGQGATVSPWIINRMLPYPVRLKLALGSDLDRDRSGSLVRPFLLPLRSEDIGQVYDSLNGQGQAID